MTTPFPSARFDVACIGNAIVDILSPCDDAFLAQESIRKGGMTLIDTPRAMALSARAEEAKGGTKMVSGGSAANTAVGVVSLSGRAAFIGRVKADALGDAYVQDLRRASVEDAVSRQPEGEATGRCLIFVTPDGERSMNTFLGAASELSPADVPVDIVQAARVLYLEGYLFDKPSAQEAYRTAATLAREAGRQVALTLSDPFCVERHRAEFLGLLETMTDILFAEQREIAALYPSASVTEAAMRAGLHCPLVVVTQGAEGSFAVYNQQVIRISAMPVAKVVDSTGAGDLYAAGFLYGLAQGKTIAECGRIGSVAAAHIIQQIGPRPQNPLKNLLTENAA